MPSTIKLHRVLEAPPGRVYKEGVPDVIPAEACYLGWGESLELLRQLVEPEINDE